MSGKLRPVSAEVAELGEGPRWDAGAGELLWVDIMAGVLRRAVEDGDGLRTVAAFAVGEPLGAAAPLADGDGWLLAAAGGFRHLTADGTVTALLDTEPADVRMNDAACDPDGRFWAGSMAYDQRPGGGRLLRCDPDGTVRVVLPHATVANGLGWSPDGRTMYHADSGTGVVTAYPVDGGELGEGRVLIRPEHGVPDGLTVDAEGGLWVALHGGGEVRRYDPAGATLSVWPLPVSQPTSVALGGASGRRLFVTTAWENFTPEQRAVEPDAGRVFAADDAGVSAPPVRPFRGLLPRTRV
ncbi:MAG TPA: SMP-30/gluconolactonase/LRE family protein [Mycobacteriales bacterium]